MERQLLPVSIPFFFGKPPRLVGDQRTGGSKSTTFKSEAASFHQIPHAARWQFKVWQWPFSPGSFGHILNWSKPTQRSCTTPCQNESMIGQQAWSNGFTSECVVSRLTLP